MTKQPLVQLHGTVRHYQGNGRKFGYPTANMATSTELADGVYFGYADLAEYIRQPALIFVGTPVTVGDTVRRVEAHLLDIKDIDYYGQGLAIDIYCYHRANQKFDSVDDLLTAMKNDEAVARNWFASQK